MQTYKEDFEAERRDRELLKSKMVDQGELTQSKGQKSKGEHVLSHVYIKQLEGQLRDKNTQLAKLQDEDKRLKSTLEDKNSLIKQLVGEFQKIKQECDKNAQLISEMNKQNEEKLAAKESELRSAKEELEKKVEDYKFEKKRSDEMVGVSYM